MGLKMGFEEERARSPDRVEQGPVQLLVDVGLNRDMWVRVRVALNATRMVRVPWWCPPSLQLSEVSLGVRSISVEGHATRWRGRYVPGAVCHDAIDSEGHDAVQL